MAKPEWGQKRKCLSCTVPFYDMKKSPIVCPSCAAVFDPDAVLRPRRSRAPVDAPKPKPVPQAANDDATNDDATNDDAAKDDELAGVDVGVDVEDDDDDDDDDAALEDTSDLEGGDADVPSVGKTIGTDES